MVRTTTRYRCDNKQHTTPNHSLSLVADHIPKVIVSAERYHCQATRKLYHNKNYVAMRLTAELLLQAEQRTNPDQDRELVLRDWGIPAIEHFGATKDDFDAIDLTNNRLLRLENFPRLRRLSNLLCAENLIESIDGKNLEKNVPNLKSLTLSYNNLSSLAQVATLGDSCRKLEFLSLVGNPVTRTFFLSDIYDRFGSVGIKSTGYLWSL